MGSNDVLSGEEPLRMVIHLITDFFSELLENLHRKLRNRATPQGGTTQIGMDTTERGRADELHAVPSPMESVSDIQATGHPGQHQAAQVSSELKPVAETQKQAPGSDASTKCLQEESQPIEDPTKFFPLPPQSWARLGGAEFLDHVRQDAGHLPESAKVCTNSLAGASVQASRAAMICRASSPQANSPPVPFPTAQTTQSGVFSRPVRGKSAPTAATSMPSVSWSPIANGGVAAGLQSVTAVACAGTDVPSSEYQALALSPRCPAPTGYFALGMHRGSTPSRLGSLHAGSCTGAALLVRPPTSTPPFSNM